jgi:S-DNA-T family DNA segregation ATPase FtsK/SpoIIIE
LLLLSTLPPSDDDGRPCIGLLDLPAEQQQQPWTVDLENSACVGIFGAPRSGKTTVLRTIAAAVATAAGPHEVQLHLLDFAGGGLTGLSALPHVVASAGADDMEHVERMLLSLRRIVDARSSAFAAIGASSLAEFRTASGDRTTHPRVVVLLDGMPALAAAVSPAGRNVTIWESFVRLVSDAAGSGVTFVVTSDQTRGMAVGLQSSMTQRLALRLASGDDYTGLGLPIMRDWDPSAMPAGRCKVPSGDEMQIAVVGADAKGPAQLRALGELTSALETRYADALPAPLARLAAAVDGETLGVASEPLVAVLGVRELDEAPAVIDLRQHHLFVTGARRSGRTTAMAQVAASLAAGPGGTELRLYAPRPTTLTALEVWSRTFVGEAAAAGLAELAEELEARAAGTGAPNLVVVIDDLDDLELPRMVTAETIARRAFDRGVRIVGAGGVRGLSASAIDRELRRHTVLWLQPNFAADGDVFNTGVRRHFLAYPPGRGLLVHEGAAEVVQVAIPAALRGAR